MSQYIAAGITDTDLNQRADRLAERLEPAPAGSPVADLMDRIAKLGFDLSTAIEHPAVQLLMLNMGVKADDLRAEEKAREVKKKKQANLLLWGGVAVGVAFMALRKKS